MDLPDDVLCEIVGWLLPEEITQFRLTCKHIYENARIEAIWVNKVDWWQITYKNELSEQFIEKYIEKMNWMHLSCYQTLSEQFIEKHADKLDWYGLHTHQRLSKEI